MPLTARMAGVAMLSLIGAAPGSAAVLDLSWNDNATNEHGFIIERGEEPSGPFEEIARVGADVTAYGDVDVSPGISHCYRVRSFNAAGVSNPSNIACGSAISALPALTLSVLFNGPAMAVMATVLPETTPVLVDAYIVLQVPDGSLYSLVATNTLVPGIVAAAEHFVPVPLSGEVFRYSFTGDEPDGTYRWFAGLVEPGTLILIGSLVHIQFVK